MTTSTRKVDHKPARRHDLRCHVIDGEALLYDSDANLIHRLNTTALCIWERCDGTLTIDELTEHLTSIYDVPLDIARADVTEAVRQMEANGLLMCAPTTAP